MSRIVAQETSTGEAKDSLFDIKRIAQGRYKVLLEETWKYERPEVREPNRRWYEQIPTYCGGFIGLYQENPTVILQFYTPSARKLCRKVLERFPNKGLRLDDWQDGYETVLYFPPDILLEVCEMVGARKKRQGHPLSEEQKLKLVEAGRVFRFQRGAHGASEPQEIRGGAQLSP